MVANVVDGTADWTKEVAGLDIKLPQPEEHEASLDDARVNEDKEPDTAKATEAETPNGNNDEPADSDLDTKKDTGKGVTPPVGLNEEERQWFEGLDAAGQQAVARKFKEMDSLLTKKSQGLGELAPYAGKPETLDLLKFHAANPTVLNQVRFIDSDPILGPAVVKLVNSYAEAMRQGKQTEWKPESLFAPAKPAGPSLDRYADKSPSELQDLIYTDPEFVPALLGELGSLKSQLSNFQSQSQSLLKPIAEQSREAQLTKERTQAFERTIATLPDSLLMPSAKPDGPKQLTAEAAAEINEVMEKHGSEWLKAGKTPEQALELAAHAVVANRQEAKARKEGEAKGKEEQTRRRQQGISQTGGSPTGAGGDLSKRLVERMESGTFQIP